MKPNPARLLLEICYLAVLSAAGCSTPSVGRAFLPASESPRSATAENGNRTGFLTPNVASTTVPVTASPFSVSLATNEIGAQLNFPAGSGGGSVSASLSETAGLQPQYLSPQRGQSVASIVYRFSESDVAFSNFPAVVVSVPAVLVPGGNATFALFAQPLQTPIYVQAATGTRTGSSYQFTFGSSSQIAWVADSAATYLLELLPGSSLPNEVPNNACEGQTESHGTQASVNEALGGTTLCVPAYGTFGGTIYFPTFSTSGSGTTVLLDGSTFNVLNQPNLGPAGNTPLFYLNFSINGPASFGTDLPATSDAFSAASVTNGLIAGDYYSAYGQASVAGAPPTSLPGCYVQAFSGPDGHGALNKLGALLFNVNVPESATGVIEVYADGTSPPSEQWPCPEAIGTWF